MLYRRYLLISYNNANYSGDTTVCLVGKCNKWGQICYTVVYLLISYNNANYSGDTTVFGGEV